MVEGKKKKRRRRRTKRKSSIKKITISTTIQAKQAF